MSAELKMVRALREEVAALNRELAQSVALIEQLERFAVPPAPDDGPPTEGPRPDSRGGVA